MAPEGWKATSLGDALDRVSRPVQVSPMQRYTQIGIRSHGRGLFIKEPVEGWELGNKRVFHVEAYCLVLNIVFAWEQAVGTTDEGHIGLIASHRFPMYRPRAGACDIEFLRHFFLTPHGKHLLGLASPGGAGRNKTLGQKEFERLTVVLPPLPEQKKIAEILSTWDKAIETTENLLTNAEAQKRALMRQLLNGKQRLEGFEGQPWPKRRLGACCDEDGSYGANSPAIEFDGSNPRYLRITDILENGTLSDSDKKSIPREEAEGYFLTSGDLVFARSGATVGKSYLHRTSEELAYAGYLIRFRPNRDILNPNFLSHYVRSDAFRIWLQQTIRAGAQPNINAREYSNLLVPCPSLHEQNMLARIFDDFDSECNGYREQIKLLQKEKTALQQQLFTGRRRVTI